MNLLALFQLPRPRLSKALVLAAISTVSIPSGAFAESFGPSLPRMTVDELQKADPLPKDEVIVTGKLHSVEIGQHGFDVLWLTSRGEKPSISATLFAQSEEPSKDQVAALVGKNIEFHGVVVEGKHIGIAGGDIHVVAVGSDPIRPQTLPPGGTGDKVNRPPVPSSAAEPQPTTPKEIARPVQPPPPNTGTLLAPLPVELKRDGQVIGSMTLQAGTSVPILKRDGTRAQIRTAGGEVWVNTASEWEIFPIMEIDQETIKRGDFHLGLTVNKGDPLVVATTQEGLIFAERKADRWQVEKIESWNAHSSIAALHLGQGKDGKPLIAYRGGTDAGSEIEFDFVKSAIRDQGNWQLSTLARVLRTLWSGTHGWPVFSGVFQGVDAVTTWPISGGLPIIWKQESDGWDTMDLHRLYFAEDESTRGIELPMYVSDVLFAGNTLHVLSWKYSFDKNDSEPEAFLGVYQFDGEKWKEEVIHSEKAQGQGETRLAAHKERLFATYSLKSDDAEKQFLARSGPSWEIVPLDGQSLGAISAVVAASDSTVGFLSSELGENGAPWKLCYSEKSFPGAFLVEEIASASGSEMHARTINQRSPHCALAFSEEGVPYIVFLGEDGNLNLATRTRSAQLATSEPVNGIFHLPEAVLTTKTMTITELPEKDRPGLEADWLQKRSERLAAIPEPTTFTMEIAGHEAEILRWGTGDKAVVFFSRMPYVDSFREGELQYDHFGESIAAQIDDYQSLLDNGFSVVTWRFAAAPPRIFSGVGRPLNEGETVEENRDLSGEAIAVVQELREKTAIQQMILVGDGYDHRTGASDLLYADLAALEEEADIRVVLVAPQIPKDEAVLARWPSTTKSTLIGSVPLEHWFSENPKGLEWVKANQSAFDDTLAPGLPRPSLGRFIPHTEFANWLLGSENR